MRLLTSSTLPARWSTLAKEVRMLMITLYYYVAVNFIEKSLPVNKKMSSLIEVGM